MNSDYFVVLALTCSYTFALPLNQYVSVSLSHVMKSLVWRLINCWALLFILKLRFPPGQSLVEILFKRERFWISPGKILKLLGYIKNNACSCQVNFFWEFLTGINPWSYDDQWNNHRRTWGQVVVQKIHSDTCDLTTEDTPWLSR